MLTAKINNYLMVGDPLIFTPSHTPLVIPDEFCVDVIMCVTEKKTITKVTGLTVQQYPIVDGNLMSFYKYIDRIMSQLTKLLSNNKKIMICCDETKSISMTVLFYYLITVKDMSRSEVENMIPKDFSYEIHPIFSRMLETCD